MHHHHHRHKSNRYPVLLPSPNPIFLPRPIPNSLVLPGYISSSVLDPVHLPRHIMTPSLLPRPVILQSPRYRIPHKYSLKSGIINYEEINNIQIIFINLDRILLVKDEETNKWMIPMGKRGPDESFKKALHRIFISFTSFNIKSDNIKYNPRINRKMELSMVYKIISEQDDESSDNDKIIYIPKDNLDKLLNNDIPYKNVYSLVDSTKSLLDDVFL
jgi:hypothetical protein